jgi:hypothetical protein
MDLTPGWYILTFATSTSTKINLQCSRMEICDKGVGFRKELTLQSHEIHHHETGEETAGRGEGNGFLTW